MESEILQIALTVNSIDYQIKCKIMQSQLNIHLEQKNTLQMWQNTFTSTYIEDLTTKSGNRLSLQEFYEIVQKAFKQQETEKFTIDILTYQDLESLRNPDKQKLPQQMSTNNKRYLIVTQNISSQKTHFPLSLNMIDFENVEILKSHVLSLKQELEDLREKQSQIDNTSKASSKGFFVTEKQQVEKNGLVQTNSQNNNFTIVDQLKNENELLKQRIRRMEQSFQQSKGAVELDNIVKSKFELEEELEIVRKGSLQHIQKLQATVEEKEEELSRSRSITLQLQKEMAEILSQSTSQEGLPVNESIQKLKDCIIKMTYESEQQMQNSKKQIQKQTKELEKSTQEIESLKVNDRKQKQRIKQLEIELEQSIKRFSTKNTTDRLYSPYTKNTQGNSLNNRRANSVPTKPFVSKSTRNSMNNVRNTSPTVKKTTVSSANIATNNQYNFLKKKANISPSVPNRYSNQRNNFVTSNSPKDVNNNSSKGKVFSQNVQKRQFGSNYTNNILNNKSKSSISPAIRNLQQKSNDNKLLKKIEEAQRYKILSNQIPKQYSDNHMNIKCISDIDKRLNNLQNILKMAKK